MHQRQVFARMLAARQVQGFQRFQGWRFLEQLDAVEYCANQEPDLTLHSIFAGRTECCRAFLHGDT